MLNQTLNEDCLITMSKLETGLVDLVITSPPYDNLRKYSGAVWDFNTFTKIALEIWRIIKTGGIVVWVVGDATSKGGETLTSFKQALFFQSLGFTVHDTMIYQKSGFNFPANNRYHQVFEYMFVFSKGKPKTFNPILDRKNIYVGQKAHGRHRGSDENNYKDMSKIVKAKPIGEFGKRFNIWYYKVGGGNVTKDKIAYKHPAIFPDALAEDHIKSWSNPGDLVYDPFAGSGTVLKAARSLGRNYLGSEICKEYCEIITERLKIV